MATSVGAILCVGLLVLATVILLAMAIASAFIVFPAEDDPFPTARRPATRRSRVREHLYSTVV